ncbi:MAG: mechanosensitive ion channel [Gammaproteobacteria bacterium]|nr:mechanosensitive ion channel [Gammaproteobacteria bacterium]
MISTQSIRLLIALFTLLVAAGSYAQDTADVVPPSPPDLNSLQSDWWAFFEGPRDEVEPRATVFFEAVSGQVVTLEAHNQEPAQAALEAIVNNINALLALSDDAELTYQELPPATIEYSIDTLLRLAANAREARAEAAAEQLEVERERRVFDSARRQRDAAFKNYIDAEAGDERWLAGLSLLQARSTQAIAARRLDLLTSRHERAAAFALATEDRAELASTRLTTTAAEANRDGLIERVNTSRDAVDNAQENLRITQIEASGLDLDTAMGRSQQRLQQQKLRSAEIGLALAEAALVKAETQLLWTELALGTLPNTAELGDRALAWSEFIRDVERRALDWKRETEDELLAVQSVNTDDLDRASRRLLEQRLETAQGSLAQVGELGTAVADMRLLTSVVDNAAAEYSGAFKSWLASLSRGSKSTYRRVAGLGDVTLFSVGETPVTGGDILRVLLILLAAMLMSRGIRLAIRRVGHFESSGTQASLYTVSRLTHYVIIILAVFIALSSIGLEFGNIALVAGALSVGIGFGLQSIVNNFVSGLIILFEHSLRVGDYVELDTGLTGTVKSINVRSTLINTNDNIDIVVPNSEFVTARLTNWTLGERTLRVRIPFGVAYGSDKELVKQAALEAAAEVQYTLTHTKGREPDVWLVEFGDSSLNFLLLVWVNRQGARRPTRTRSAYLWALESKLREHGIEIPFPQRDLNLRTGWPAAMAPASVAEN